MFGAVEGLLLFLCGSGEYDELTLADMLSSLAKAVVTLCRQGSKNQRATETASVSVLYGAFSSRMLDLKTRKFIR